jgi:hypothetical protein
MAQLLGNGYKDHLISEKTGSNAGKTAAVMAECVLFPSGTYDE